MLALTKKSMNISKTLKSLISTAKTTWTSMTSTIHSNKRQIGILVRFQNKVSVRTYMVLSLVCSKIKTEGSFSAVMLRKINFILQRKYKNLTEPQEIK